jgi:chromosome segregation ATPase
MEVAHLKGQVEVLASQLAQFHAADEHRRAELEAVRAEQSDARAAEREWQGRLEESRRMIAELRDRLTVSEAARVRAEEERQAVIAALGRKARRYLAEPGAPA